MGNLSNLKLTAEKSIDEQASAKTDLEMANLKLRMLTEYIHGLEEKLQSTINENAKLQMKQKEDSKLWKGLESRFSSTKALYDRLTQTLRQLDSLVRQAEQDKKRADDKFSASGDAFHSLQLHFDSLMMKIKSAEENLRISEKQIAELRTEKDEKEKAYVNERNKISELIEEQDSLVKGLEEYIAAENLQLENLTSSLDRLQRESQKNDDICRQLRVTLDNLEKEKHSLQSSNSDYARISLESGLKIKFLEDSLQVELDKHSSSVPHNVSQLNTAFDTCYKLAQQEKKLTVKRAQGQFDQVRSRFSTVTAENTILKNEAEDLQRKIIEQQKGQELLISQHAEECHLREEKIESLELHAKNFLFGKPALELNVRKLREDIECMSQLCYESEAKLQIFLQDTKLFEDKFSTSGDAFDNLQLQCSVLRVKLKSVEESLRTSEEQIAELRTEKEEKEKAYVSEHNEISERIEEREVEERNRKIVKLQNGQEAWICNQESESGQENELDPSEEIVGHEGPISNLHGDILSVIVNHALRGDPTREVGDFIFAGSSLKQLIRSTEFAEQFCNSHVHPDEDRHLVVQSGVISSALSEMWDVLLESGGSENVICRGHIPDDRVMIGAHQFSVAFGSDATCLLEVMNWSSGQVIFSGVTSTLSILLVYGFGRVLRIFKEDTAVMFACKNAFEDHWSESSLFSARMGCIKSACCTDKWFAILFKTENVKMYRIELRSGELLIDALPLSLRPSYAYKEEVIQHKDNISICSIASNGILVTEFEEESRTWSHTYCISSVLHEPTLAYFAYGIGGDWIAITIGNSIYIFNTTLRSIVTSVELPSSSLSSSSTCKLVVGYLDSCRHCSKFKRRLLLA